jgi:hypothetical protein
MEVNLLFPVRVSDIKSQPGGSHVFFVDCANQKVFDDKGFEVNKDIQDAILNDLWQQRQVSAIEVDTESVQKALDIQSQLLGATHGR